MGCQEKEESEQQVWLRANESFDSYTISLVTISGQKISQETPISRIYVKPESRKGGEYTIAYGGAKDPVSIHPEVEWGIESDEPEGSRLYHLAEVALFRNSIFRRLPMVNTIIPSFYRDNPQFALSQPLCKPQLSLEQVAVGLTGKSPIMLTDEDLKRAEEFCKQEKGKVIRLPFTGSM